ncbi:unannotated protein [freshwater metagenome]|uniref:Unannotated protein n=1 Tax=freshwater metagenome TaxID=449393 RepID=A0A6J7NUZ6_9ZZZZ
MFEIVDKLSKDLGAHIGKNTAAELSDLSGHCEIGSYRDVRFVARSFELCSDCGAGISLTASVTARRVENRFEVDVIALDEDGLAFVLRLDRTNLDLDNASVLIAFDLLELRTWQAWRNSLNVGQHLPRHFDWHAYIEGVD